MTKNIVLIDGRVADYQTLIAGLGPDTEWYLLDADKDGLAQMQKVLAGYGSLDSIQVISHGSSGTLYLGSTVLTQNNMSTYQSQLQAIGSSLTAGGDILLYGCNVAQGDVGRAFVDSLATSTGADIAASDNATGASNLGGDWYLEVAAGAITASSLSINNYSRILATINPPTYSGEGRVIIDPVTAGNYRNTVALQGDGKILLASTGMDAAGGTYKFSLSRLNTDGSLDRSFYGSGNILVDISGNLDSCQDAAVNSDGTIYLAGYAATTNASGIDFCVVRIGPSGEISYITQPVSDSYYASDEGRAIALQSDGKILVAGTVQTFVGGDPIGSDFGVIRLNTDGSLDRSFSSDGKVIEALGGIGLIDKANDIAVQSDGKILVAGTSSTVEEQSNFSIMRLKLDGSLDSSFGNGGKILIDAGGLDLSDSAASVAIQPDGKILMVGDSWDGVRTNFSIVRLRSDGSLDTAFDKDGKLLLNVGGDIANYATSIALQTDGKILVAGASHYGGMEAASGFNFSIIRLTSDGSLDRAFNGNGKVIIPFVGYLSGAAQSITVQSDGKILVSGNCFTGTYSKDGVIRLNADGSIDTTFGADAINTLYGTNDADIINGRMGADTMVGYSGDDIYIVDDSGDIVVENAIEGTDLIRSSATYRLPAYVENLELAGVNRLNGTGNSLNNSIIGNGGANVLNGLTGADTMTGGDGSDSYYVDNAGDVVIESNVIAGTGGTDIVNSYIADYTLGANVENGRICASGAANLRGNGLANILYAGNGVNVIDGGIGIDTVSYRYASTTGSNGVVLNLSVLNASGYAVASGISGADKIKNIENIVGSNHNDSLTGNGGANVLNGLAGTDTMAGGAGNDTYVIDAHSDVVLEKGGEGIDLIQSPISFSLVDTDGVGGYGGNVENLRLIGTENINGTGNALNNVIYANTGVNIIDGGVGVDTVSYLYATTAGSMGITLDLSIADVYGYSVASGISGADRIKNIENITGSNFVDILVGNGKANVLNGLDGADTMAGGLGNDTYVVNSNADVITELPNQGTDLVISAVSYSLWDTDGVGSNGGNVEDLRLVGSGNINAQGNMLDNVLFANSGNNFLDGVFGVDTANYQLAAAGVTVSLALNSRQDTVGSGLDYLLNIDNLTGSNYADALTGDSYANVLDGQGGDDIINGGAGADTIIGGAGKDSLTGGTGADTFKFNALSEFAIGVYLDTISDFTQGQDEINLAAIDADPFMAGNQAFTIVDTFTPAAGQVRYSGGIIYFNTDADVDVEYAIQLTGSTPVSLTAADFVL